MEIIILDNLSHCARYIQFEFSLRKNSKRGILVLSIGWSVSNLLVECQGRSYLKLRLITMVNNHADSTFWPSQQKTVGQPTRLVGCFFSKIQKKNVFSKTPANEKPTIFRWPTDGRFFSLRQRRWSLTTPPHHLQSTPIVMGMSSVGLC